MDDVQKKLDELVKKSDLFISSPETIRHLQSMGLPIKSKTVSYEEYLDKLFEAKRAQSSELIAKLPSLDESIAISPVVSLYEELKECFVLGINGASIILAILLLDLSSKYRLHKERLKTNIKASWNPIEEMQLSEVINELHKLNAINDSEFEKLSFFNSKIRNNYLHYNIKKLVKGMILPELTAIDVKTGEETIEKNVKAKDRPFLWFSAKKALDKQTTVDKVNFCVGWVNKLLR